jgi:hypothetical protein
MKYLVKEGYHGIGTEGCLTLIATRKKERLYVFFPDEEDITPEVISRYLGQDGIVIVRRTISTAALYAARNSHLRFLTEHQILNQ